VIADHTANPAFVAADLLSQAEHGVDSQVVLVAVDLTSQKLEEIEKEVNVQAHALSRVDIVRQSIAKSIIAKTLSVEEAIAFSNDYAPEHLILHLANASEKVPLINNAGSIFVGAYTPERFVLVNHHVELFLTSRLAVVIMHLGPITHCLPMDMHVSSAELTRCHSKNTSRHKKSRWMGSRTWGQWSQL
jgi:hypothetical protein